MKRYVEKPSRMACVFPFRSITFKKMTDKRIERTDELVKWINSNLSFPPSKEQNHALHLLSAFLFDKNAHPVFILSGYAGTGKTSILGALVKALAATVFKTKLMAPTGRAAKVLAKRSGKSALTVHKQIYWPGDEHEIGLRLQLNLHTDTVFIVDEASMISAESFDVIGNRSTRNLLEDLINYVFSGKNCRLVLLGDRGQLPPVGALDSPALQAEKLQQLFSGIKVETANLTEVYRQAEGSGILSLVTRIRSSDSLKFNPSLFEQVKEIGSDELQDVLETAYTKAGTDETIVITRSNKRAGAFNQFIRSRILWMEEDLCTGDRVMVVKNNYFWISPESVMGFIANGEMAEVLRIRKRLHIYGFEFAHLIVRFIDYPLEEHEVIVFMETLHSDLPALPRERLKTLFFEIEKDYLHEHNRKKRHQLILRNPYFNALQLKFAYAVTCHKSQGGQWEQVLVDAGGKHPDISEKEERRWLYTACTRATEQLFLVHFPEEYLDKND
jgi:exodeoxyribonuclease-5